MGDRFSKRMGVNVQAADINRIPGNIQAWTDDPGEVWGGVIWCGDGYRTDERVGVRTSGYVQKTTEKYNWG